MPSLQLVLAGFAANATAWIRHALVLLGDTSISDFFGTLYGKLIGIALAVSTFFFAWAAILYTASGTGNERAKQHAQGALYAALIGLGLALLAGTIAGIVKSATGTP